MKKIIKLKIDEPAPDNAVFIKIEKELFKIGDTVVHGNSFEADYTEPVFENIEFVYWEVGV